MDSQKQEIETMLGKFWDERAIEMGESPDSTEDLGAPLDSLTSIEALIEIDRLMNRKIPVEAVIQKGGYQTRAQFIEGVTTNVLKFVEEHPE